MGDDGAYGVARRGNVARGARMKAKVKIDRTILEQESKANGELWRRVRVRGKWTPVVRRVK